MAGKNPHVDISPIKVSIQIAFNKFIYAICISLLQVLNSYSKIKMYKEFTGIICKKKD